MSRGPISTTCANCSSTAGTATWTCGRLEHNALHTGNPYPTHGLGPLCQVCDIHRGDRMERLVSLSSDQFGMSAYATAKYGAESAEAERPYALGDMNTTLIRTARGKSILIQHDVTCPRPYNRLHTISGTKGFAQKYPIRHLAFDPDAHHRLSDEQLDQTLRAATSIPLRAKSARRRARWAATAAWIPIMDYRLVYCLRHGLPLDQDVYDAAEWSSLAELAEASVRNGSMPCRDARLHARRMAQGRGLLARDGRVTPAAPGTGPAPVATICGRGGTV